MGSFRQGPSFAEVTGFFSIVSNLVANRNPVNEEQADSASKITNLTVSGKKKHAYIPECSVARHKKSQRN